MPMRTLSYLSVPWPCTRRLFNTAASIVVVGEDRAAVAIAAERLGRKEARRRDVADRADLATPVGGAKALRGVAEDPQPVRRRDRQDRVVVGRLTEEIDWDDPDWLQPEVACAVAMPASRLAGSILKVSSQHVDKHRRSRRTSATTSAVAAKVKEGTSTACPGLEVLRHQREPQRVGAVGAAQHVFRAAKRGELLLEGGHLRAHDVAAVIDDAQDRLVDAPADAGGAARRDR